MPSKKRVRIDLLQSRYTVRLDRATYEWIEDQAKSGHSMSGQDFIRSS
jgi:hypothetical protein